MGDSFFRHDPPFIPQPWPPTVPPPLVAPPWTPWPLEKLREYHDLLQRVKELEDKLGCPCEPNKADYLGMFEERIKELERRVAEKSVEAQEGDERTGALAASEASRTQFIEALRPYTRIPNWYPGDDGTPGASDGLRPSRLIERATTLLVEALREAMVHLANPASAGSERESAEKEEPKP